MDLSANTKESVDETDLGEDEILSSSILKPLTPISDKENSEDIASPNFSCTEKDACAYLAVYVAYKLKDKAPQLSQETTVSDFSQPWIVKISLGF